MDIICIKNDAVPVNAKKAVTPKKNMIPVFIAEYKASKSSSDDVITLKIDATNNIRIDIIDTIRIVFLFVILYRLKIIVNLFNNFGGRSVRSRRHLP